MGGQGARAGTVLFVCTGNSARSILAEALLNRHGGGRIRACSAGSHPRGQVHPLALELLAAKKLDTAAARSKGWEEFAGPAAPRLDLVVTVCDRAANETCPAWPGDPPRRHWDISDPTTVEGDDDARRRAFLATFETLERRIRELVANW